MEKYLTDMLERMNYVILQVINKVFHSRPNLLMEIREMHVDLERQLKAECHRELELILDMEESFVYADHSLYKEALKQTKILHRSESSTSATITTTTHQIARSPVPLNSNAGFVSRKRKKGAISEDNDDDDDRDGELVPSAKAPRTTTSATAAARPSGSE